MLLWTAALLAALGLAWLIGAVLVPILQARTTVCEYFDHRVDEDEAVERLGGPDRAAARLHSYLRLPEAVAPFKASAASLLAWGTLPTKADVVAALRDPDVHVRRAAGHRLAQTLTCDDKGFVPDLIRALEDKDANVRFWAAHSLGRIGPSALEATPALIRALADPDPDSFVGDATADALGRIGMEIRVTVPALVKALKSSSPKVRVGAVQALRFIGPAAVDASPALTAACEDADAEVTRWAKCALRETGGFEGRPGPEIEKALNSDDPEMRAAGAEVLKQWLRGNSYRADAAIRKIRGEEPAK
jgi:HEAT repeat protein